MEFERRCWAEVDLGALRHNFKLVRERAGDAAVMAVVKADAYGHGDAVVAPLLEQEGADQFAVSGFGEAVCLRRAGVTKPILILGYTGVQNAAALAVGGISQTVFSLEYARALSEAALRAGVAVRVHLKVDTGMGRIGIRPEEIGALAAAVKQLPNIEIEGMFSHFAMADSKDKTYTKGQLAKFEQALKAVEEAGVKLKIRHIAESAAILEIPEAHYDMVRAGVIQYGMWPSDEVTHPIDLKPVMKVCAKVVFMKMLHPGESIGYGRQFIAERESRIATLPIGYADGYIRAYGNGGYVSFGGRKAPIAGRVCMDQVMVDVTDLPDVKEGDTAVLFGDETVTADTAAKWLNTIFLFRKNIF